MSINHAGGVQAIGPDIGLEVMLQELPSCTGKFLIDSFTCPGLSGGMKHYPKNNKYIAGVSISAWVKYVALAEINLKICHYC
jgi:hypothetical protein